MLDSSGRRVHYLRVSVTDRCNQRCVYCMPPEGVEFVPHDRILSFERIAAVAEAAASLGFDKVRLTGGEPLVRRGVADLVSMLAAIDGLTTIAMTTNGTLLAPIAAELKARGLSSVNVSLDTLDPGRYAEMTRGGRVEDALAGVRAARAAGLPVKLNVVVSAGERRDEEAIRSFAAEEGCAVQTIRRYRLDADKFDDRAYDRPGPCGDCDRIRLLATGELRPCLHGDRSVAIDWNDVAGSVRACVEAKPAKGARTVEHLVSSIGG